MTTQDTQKATYYADQFIQKGVVVDDYNEWVKYGLSLASLGEDGRELFHKISSTSSKYDYQSTDEKFTELLKSYSGEITLGSFIQPCVDLHHIPPYRNGHKAPTPVRVSAPTELPPRKETDASLKHFKDYIIREEPTEEKGIISINGVWVLSTGNVLLMTGPIKSRKTMLASILVNQSKLKTAYIDSEQGKKHSWRTGKFTPAADVFHLRGEDQTEIMRVINCCIESGEYGLMVLDNLRDLLKDFNNVDQSGELELFLKKISEQLPVIAILHENKKSQSGQGHLGHGAAKIAQTTVRVQLVDVEDPAQGSFVECVHSRDEPFKRAFISMDGILSNNTLFKTNGKSMLLEDVLRQIGGQEYTRNELNETLAEIFGITPKTAANVTSQLRKAWPGVFSQRKEGKTVFFHVSSILQ